MALLYLYGNPQLDLIIIDLNDLTISECLEIRNLLFDSETILPISWSYAGAHKTWLDEPAFVEMGSPP